ncbi:YfhO family protein [bacterium]|nr:YfhO family protein [bacterium]
MKNKPSRTTKAAAPQTAPASKAWHNLWENQGPLKQHVIAALFLLVVSIAFYAPIHFSGKQIIAGDTVNWRGMAESMIEYEAETGEVALWAGRTFAGMPGYMISPELTVPQVDIIMKELRLLFWPTSHLMLLFLGMYWLAWYVTRNSMASILGALAFGLTTYLPVILVAGHNSKFIALAWAPWMFLAFVHAMKKRNLVSALLFAVALAANLRAGHVQITYYVTFAAGIWWIVEGVHAARSKQWSDFIKSTGVLALGSVLGLLMVAEPYLAHAELAPYTTRGTAAGGAIGGMAWSYAMAWSQGISELLTLFISDTFGGAGATYWGPKIFTGGPHHFGAIILALGALAVWKVRDRTTLSLALGALVLTLFSLGENLAVVNKPMYEYFPMFSAFRVPETWLSIVAMLVALLAARGLASVSVRRGAGLWSVPTMRAMVGALGLALILFVFGSSLLSFEKPLERDQMLAQIQRQYPTISASDPQVVSVIDQEISTRKATRLDVFKADAGRVTLFLLLAVGLVVLLYRDTLPIWAVSAGLCILVAVDLGGVGRRYVNEAALSSEKSVAEKMPLYGFDSFLIGQKDQAGGDGAFRVLSLEFGRDPSTNARPSFYYESMGGYSAAKLRNYQDFIDHVLFTGSGTGINQAAMDMMNIKFVVAGQEIPGFKTVYQDEPTGMFVLENPSVLSRAYLVDRVVTAPSSEELWAKLNDPAFLPSSEAVVLNAPESLLSLSTAASDSTSTREVQAGSYSAQHMAFSVNSDRERLLVVSEVYYEPGWTAEVNGVPAPIVSVDQLLRGVVVPAGQSEVTLSFAPPSFAMGRLLSGIGTMLTYGLLLFFGFLELKKRRSLGHSAA